MKNIKSKIKTLQEREKIVKHKKYKINESNHLSKDKSVKRLEYEFYICDYCGKIIIIKDKWEEKQGGIIKIPSSITGSTDVNLVLHNKCIKPLLIDLEEKDE